MFAARDISPESGCARRREHRHKVLIRARMRAGAFPVDVCISNVSSRGICAITATPPPRGTYVELTDTPLPIVGQVVWSSSRRFGIAVQDSIDLSRLMAHQQARTGGAEQGSLQARTQKAAAGSRDRLSREEGQKTQFLFVVIAAAAATLLIGQLVYTQLSQAADAVAAGLREPR